MRIRIDYGTTGLEVELPDDATTVVEPTHQPPSPAPRETLLDALRQPVAGPPLREIANPGQTVAISVCDITRPQPRQLMLEAILDELDGVVRPADVTIVIATGTHRASTDEELQTMLGERIASECRVVDHSARDRSALVDVGMVGAVPVTLNREWIDPSDPDSVPGRRTRHR